MHRALGPQTVSGSLQPARRPRESCLLGVSARCRRSTCQAASAFSNGDSETAPGAQAGPAKTVTREVRPSSTPTAGADSIGISPGGSSTASSWASLDGTGPATTAAPNPSSSANGDYSGDNIDSSTGAAPGPTFSAAFLRRLVTASSPLDVAEAWSDELASAAASPAGGPFWTAGGPTTEVREEDARAVLTFLLQRGKVDLAVEVYREMCQARRGGGGAGGSGSGGSAASRSSLDVTFTWPAVTLATTQELVLGLCRQLCTVKALQVLADMKGQGLPRGSEEVGFGKVITSPLASDRPLTVVQPQEGAKTVADGYSRYEYEVFSGTTISCSSTALDPSGNVLLGLARAVGIIKKPPVAAIHEFVLQAPDSTSRTFRVGTETAAVPAQVGERVTVVSAPTRNIRQGGLFNASPPGTKPGEALTATNHKTGVVLRLLRPPISAEQAGLPGWVLPLAVVLAGGDAASSLLDPALPLLLAAGAASLAGSAALTSSFLVPRLKQLPDGKVRVEFVRQQLLGQYNSLTAKAAQALTESAEDVRTLARLWQLQNKMEAAGSAGAALYAARMGRVEVARANIEERMSRRIELLDGYSRVMNMIEIEVEMDIEVPAAELAGIQEQVSRLVELEGLQEDWRAQAEARDEVERLLRAT